MARPRKPDEVLELNRTFAKNPQRKRPAAPKSVHPIGNPPKDFSKEEKQAWKEICTFAPANVLTGADRMTVEMLSRMMAEFRSRQPMTSADKALLVSLLGKMGMTPADRSKVTAVEPEQKQDDPYAKFRVVA